MSDLEIGGANKERRRIEHKDRTLPPEFEEAQRERGVDAEELWTDIYRAADSEVAAAAAYQKFIQEGYVPSVIRAFCDERKGTGKTKRTEMFRPHTGHEEPFEVPKNTVPPKTFILGKAAIIPPEAPDYRKNRSTE